MTVTRASEEAVASKGARVFPIPPPAYYGAAFASGMFLQGVAPLDLPGRPATSILGAAVLVAGLALDVAGVATVISNRTTLVPHRPVRKLLTGGIYRFSRNPMYTGLAIVVAGGALLAGTGWPLLTLLPALVAVRQLVIKPEETYLAERYGPVYAEYRLTTRRWL